MKNSTSPKQAAANRTNAAHSTGPRTPLGKARASQNARKHLFAGTDFAIVKIEDLEAVDRLRADLIAVYQPVNAQETFAVERIALAQHTLLRLARLETGLFATSLNRALYNLEHEAPIIPLHEELRAENEANPDAIRMQNRYYFLAQGFHQMNRENPASWGLFLRYQNQAERHYRRTIEEFDRLKALRGVFPNEPIFVSQPDETAATCAPENEPIVTPESPDPEPRP